jgi:hypothetical protein
VEQALGLPEARGSLAVHPAALAGPSKADKLVSGWLGPVAAQGPAREWVARLQGEVAAAMECALLE